MAELMKAFGDGEFRLILRIFFRNLNVRHSHALLLPRALLYRQFLIYQALFLLVWEDLIFADTYSCRRSFNKISKSNRFMISIENYE
jgi:hypothetical protein